MTAATGLSWMLTAECRKHDPSLFDTEKLTGPGAGQRMRQREAMAKEICAACPVRDKCLEYGILTAIEHEAIEQIYGGLTPQEMAGLVDTYTRWSSGVLRFAA